MLLPARDEEHEARQRAESVRDPMRAILFVFIVGFIYWLFVVYHNGKNGVPMSSFEGEVYNRIRTFLSWFKY